MSGLNPKKTHHDKELERQIEILTVSQLQRLKEHKYSAECVTILDPYMQVFWRWLVEQLPMHWAPNMITLSGLACNIITSLILIFHCPSAVEPPPRWTCMLFGLGIFIYQSLDAVDGKQARRTNSSSPMGELFDHGCDSVSTVFLVLSFCCMMGIGNNLDILMVMVLGSLFIFYCAHWQTYCTGTLYFGKIDVTEAQVVMIISSLITTLFGHEIWDFAIPQLGVPLRVFPVILGCGGGILSIITSFDTLHKGGKGKNGSTVAETSVLSPFAPIVIVMALCIMIAKSSPSNIYTTYPCFYLIAFGMCIAKITNRLVVAHMSKSEFGLLDSAMFGPLLLFLNQYLNCPVPEVFVLTCCLIYCTYDLLNYQVIVCRQISDYLNINIFSLDARNTPDKKSQ